MVPRGKMLGGSSALNYMAYVRGHPGDYDAWAKAGAAGWSYRELLPYFKKSEGLAPQRRTNSDDIDLDADAHNTAGPLGVSVRAPVLTGSATICRGGCGLRHSPRRLQRPRPGNPRGVVSLFQTTTQNGKRSSTYHAFLEGEAEQRPNLTIITGAHATRVLLDGPAGQKSPQASSTASTTARAARRWPPRKLCSAAAPSDRRSCCSCRASDRGKSWIAGHGLPGRFAARRQTPERSSGAGPVLSRAGRRCFDDRNGPFVRVGRPACAGRPPARQSGRRRAFAAGAVRRSSRRPIAGSTSGQPRAAA